MVDPEFNDNSGSPAHNYGFYKDVTKTVVPKLTYDKENNRLVASYDTGMAIDKAKLDALAKTYEDAAIAYEDALEEYAAAVGDLEGRTPPGGTSKTLKDESDTLRTKLAELLAAKQAEDAAWDTYEKGVKDAERLKAIMDAAEEEKNSAAADLGTQYVLDNNGNPTADLAVYTPAAGNTPAQNDTLWGRYNAALNDLGTDPAATTGTTKWALENIAKAALGEETDAKSSDPNASAWAQYNQAKDDLEHAEESARNAFLDLLAAKKGLADRAAAINYLSTVTYEQLVNDNITNVTGTAEYDYYRMAIAEKYAKENRDAKQAAYDTAVANRVAAQEALATALANRQAAEVALGDTANASNYDTTTAAGRYNQAAKDYKEQMEKLYGLTDTTDANNPKYGINGKAEDGKYVTGEYNATSGAGSLYGTYMVKKATTASKQAEVDAQQAVYILSTENI